MVPRMWSKHAEFETVQIANCRTVSLTEFPEPISNSKGRQKIHVQDCCCYHFSPVSFCNLDSIHCLPKIHPAGYSEVLRVRFGALLTIESIELNTLRRCCGCQKWRPIYLSTAANHCTAYKSYPNKLSSFAAKAKNRSPRFLRAERHFCLTTGSSLLITVLGNLNSPRHTQSCSCEAHSHIVALPPPCDSLYVFHSPENLPRFLTQLPRGLVDIPTAQHASWSRPWGPSAHVADWK